MTTTPISPPEEAVKLVALTRPVSVIGGLPSSLTPEQMLVFVARVSSPGNQARTDTAAKLIAYLIKNRHWSPFEMVDMTVEIRTSRAIAAQILRHRSFSFQEFSQRYAVATDACFYNARRQAEKNRQDSVDDLPEEDRKWFLSAQLKTWADCQWLYEEALRRGIAKECARFLLPLSTKTRMYMKGSLRSWIHYLQVRTDSAAQKEHRDIADAIKAIFVKEFPATSEALGWWRAPELDHGL